MLINAYRVSLSDIVNGGVRASFQQYGTRLMSLKSSVTRGSMIMVEVLQATNSKVTRKHSIWDTTAFGIWHKSTLMHTDKARLTNDKFLGGHGGALG